ncbi:hypothetical protein GMDG_02593 [Pseudogymnoascus destructans 20631-21]|uniref:Uncharacterized protein n=1 Tax=Pseudogymnoascus destructans (strain ATCC MYA-4855 / 20631-21) TaxID=658429 RepID=L8G699_PSED2|nr:hypothetical protein GMDG_02593 [Pseudogymnoascus destructans 20631-21]
MYRGVRCIEDVGIPQRLLFHLPCPLYHPGFSSSSIFVYKASSFPISWGIYSRFRRACSGSLEPFQFVFLGLIGCCPDSSYLFGHVAVAIAAGSVAVAWCMRRITVLGHDCISVPGS